MFSFMSVYSNLYNVEKYSYNVKSKPNRFEGKGLRLIIFQTFLTQQTYYIVKVSIVKIAVVTLPC